MAGIEKICEFSSECPGYLMYGYKQNLIQIMPEYRKLFRKAEHELHIWKPEKKLVTKSGSYMACPKIHPDAHNCNKWSDEQWNIASKNGFVKRERTRQFSICGELEEYEFVFTSHDDIRTYYKKHGRHFEDFYTWELRVTDPKLQGEVKGKYHNWGFNISTTKRKLKRMLKCKELNVIRHNMTYSEYCNLKD